MKQNIWIGVALSIVIALLLASRNLYVALDDNNYIVYFSIDDAFSGLSGHWWNYLLDEPLWRLYCMLLGKTFGPEGALRVTIFFSTLMFLVASGKLTRGAWVLVFFAFVIDDNLATQMYFNQIRQGFALSIFLIIIAIGFSSLWGAAVAALVHSSFLPVIPCLLMAMCVRKFNVHWIIAVMVTFIGAYVLFSLSPNIDLGRRSEYELASHLTLTNYIVSGFQYAAVLTFFFRNRDSYDNKQQVWIYLSLIYFIFVTCLSLFHEVAGRLMNFENVFIMILLGLTFKRAQVKVVALLWLLLILAIQIKESQKINNLNNSTFDRWALILNVK